MLALTAGHNRLDLDALAARLERGARMANADEARRATGYAIGGTPLFGHPEPIETLIDPALLEHDVVYAAAGTPDRCFDRFGPLQAVTELSRGFTSATGTVVGRG